MRKAILLTRKSGQWFIRSAGEWKPVDDLREPVTAIKRDWKNIVTNADNDDNPHGFERVEVWTSSGGLGKRKNLVRETVETVTPKPPEPVKEPEPENPFDKAAEPEAAEPEAAEPEAAEPEESPVSDAMEPEALEPESPAAKPKRGRPRKADK